MLDLKVKDFNLAHNLVTVRTAKKGNKKRGKKVKKEKLAHKRMLTIPGELSKKVAKHISEEGLGSEDRVFAFSRQWFHVQLKKCAAGFAARAKASSPAFMLSSHSFRGMACTHCYMRGADLHAILSLTGHSDIRTLCSYINSNMLSKRKVCSILDLKL